MKKKIKIRDLTKEQYDKYLDGICPDTRCSSCPFGNVECVGATCWFNHKDLYSDKFLNQEIEIEIPELLDKEEKEYLENVVRPFKDRVIYVRKGVAWDEEFIRIRINSFDDEGFEEIDFPFFKKGTMYIGLKLNREYKLKELGLFQKIKFTEFWKSKNELAIHCKTQEEAKLFCKKADELRKTWSGGNSYLENDYWNNFREETCYSNKRQRGNKKSFASSNYLVYEFEDIDFEN